MLQGPVTTKKDENPFANHVCGIPSTAHLVARAKEGCSECFGSLCAPHTPRLLKAALRITRNKEDAEDAVQDSLMRAFMGIHEFRGASSFSTWLTRIVINSALMIRRKNQNVPRISLDSEFETASQLNLQIEDSAPDPEETLVALERQKALRTAISSLRPRVRAVLVAGHLREFSVMETAKVLNISVAAAKGRLFHGRAALRNSPALRAVVQSRTKTAA